MKLSVEGANVLITKLVLGWDNRRDTTLTEVGALAAGAHSAPMDPLGRKARLQTVTMEYQILRHQPTATVKIWGLD